MNNITISLNKIKDNCHAIDSETGEIYCHYCGSTIDHENNCPILDVIEYLTKTMNNAKSENYKP